MSEFTVNATAFKPLVLALMLAGSGLAQADDNDCTAATAADCTDKTMDRSTMDHGNMDHSAMNHEGMDHSKMDHGAMNHEGMDHSKMDHSKMDHSAMNHEGMDHSKMDHSSMKMDGDSMPMDHSKMDHSAMNHEGMDHSKMDHSKMEHCDMMKDAGSMPMDHGSMNHGAMNHEGMDHGSMNHDMSGMQGGKAPAKARDPHAWSDGYQRFTGPYVPQNVGHLHTMDSHSFSSLKVNELEQVNEGDNGIARVSGEFWYGTTWDRAVLEFDAERDNGATDAELGAYWQHAYTAFWNTRLGVRQDISPEVKRTWLGAGFEGLAPYWFESEAMLFVGEEGVAELALHSDYDLLLSQRLVLQPSLQASFHNKQDPKGQFDAGLSNSTMGVRLRYEFTRQFAPYVGVEREHWFGGSADLVGERAVNRWMAGVKFWF